MSMGIALLAITGIGSVTDPEKVMPLVLEEYLPMGLRGLVIAGLLAAFMSTFSSTVNSGASYLVRDIWQPLLGPRTSERLLVIVGYAATIAMAAAGLAIGFQTGSIGGAFTWIMMELGAAFVIPNVLRWYWWRINGWGYAAGTLLGMLGAVAVPIAKTVWGVELPLYYSFPMLCGISLLGTMAGTLLTAPTEEKTLVEFFRKVRPFGAWGPVRAKVLPLLDADEASSASESLVLAAVNVILGGVSILGIYLFPMYLVGHWHRQAFICLAVSVATGVLLYFTWYRNLPAAEQT